MTCPSPLTYSLANINLTCVPNQIDELWDSMCQAAVKLISKALPEVDNAEIIIDIKNLIALFMQTMNVGKPPGQT